VSQKFTRNIPGLAEIIYNKILDLPLEHELVGETSVEQTFGE